MKIELLPLPGVPTVRPGADLVALLSGPLLEIRPQASTGDVLVVCQKIVSRSEGSVVDLGTIEPSPLAIRFSAESGKDPRVVEVALQEARRIVRMDRGRLIVETRHGLVCANGGVDESNTLDPDTVVLLPEDPDASARRLREGLAERTGDPLAVCISDTFGRPWRNGLVDFAIGIAGFEPLLDFRGRTDLTGRELHHTTLAAADAIAAAAGLLMGKDSGIPAVLVRNAPIHPGEGRLQELLRNPDEDLFR